MDVLMLLLMVLALLGAVASAAAYESREGFERQDG